MILNFLLVLISYYGGDGFVGVVLSLWEEGVRVGVGVRVGG